MEKNKDKSQKKNEQKLNPFEVHINRSKYQILGQKSKDDHGLPGVSRGKAFKKRENTLLNEYRDRYKDSKFVDLRLGEKNATLDPERKIMLRLAAEKKKQFSKKSLYNLNDDEQLTHGGQALTEELIRNFDAFSDDDEDDVLDASFVKERNFGGDIFTKPKESNDENEKLGEGTTNKAKSRKEWIEEIIVESKKKKAESKKEKEVQNEAVSQLDSQFQDFLFLMKGRRLTEEDKEKCKKTCEFRDYDMFVNELTFDRSKRAKPSNRLKTEEEIAREEQDKLKKLEEERLRRMRGEESQVERSYRSADSLDDGLEFVPRQLSLTDHRQASSDSNIDLKKKNVSKEGSEGTSKEESSTEESGSEVEENSENEEESMNDSDGVDQEEKTDEKDKSDEYPDVFVEDSDDESRYVRNIEQHIASRVKKGKKLQSSALEQQKVTGNEQAQADKDVTSLSNELPFTFDVPSEYDEFWELLVGKTPTDVSTIVERMIACNHPSLGADNKNKTNFIFAYILQTLHIISSSDAEVLHPSYQPLHYVDSFIPHLYTITQLNPADCAAALTQVIDEKYEEYQASRPRKYPEGDTFIFLKVAGLLFPSSDYHHDVMTRVITFLTQILGEAKVACGRDAVCLLFTSSLLFEYLNRSKRFVGELVNALCSVIYTSIPTFPQKLSLPHYPPCKGFGPSSDLLVLLDKDLSEEYTHQKFQFSQLNADITLSKNHKIAILIDSLKLLTKLAKRWTHLPAVRAIFCPVKKLVENVPVGAYPKCTESIVNELNEAISALPTQVPHLKKLEGQLKTLRMAEPSFEKVIDGVKKRSGNKEFQEKQKLLHKLKRERKGAKRELKRDTQFIAREQLKEVLASDAERKRKVNVIMQGLATQESEYKKYKLGK